MKQMKSYFAILLSIALLLSLALLSASCATPAGDGGRETTTLDGETTTPSNEESSTPEEESTPAPDDDKLLYTVAVKDAAGNPIEGVRLQICSKTTGTCFLPQLLTDANGVATTSRVEDEYEIGIIVAEGYVFDKNVKFSFADGETELTITLEAKTAE